MCGLQKQKLSRNKNINKSYIKSNRTSVKVTESEHFCGLCDGSCIVCWSSLKNKSWQDYMITCQKVNCPKYQFLVTLCQFHGFSWEKIVPHTNRTLKFQVLCSNVLFTDFKQILQVTIHFCYNKCTFGMIWKMGKARNPLSVAEAIINK